MCSECLEKFNDEIGAQVWEAVNECFDVMPIAATVDDRVGAVPAGPRMLIFNANYAFESISFFCMLNYQYKTKVLNIC